MGGTTPQLRGNLAGRAPPTIYRLAATKSTLNSGCAGHQPPLRRSTDTAVNGCHEHDRLTVHCVDCVCVAARSRSRSRGSGYGVSRVRGLHSCRGERVQRSGIHVQHAGHHHPRAHDAEISDLISRSARVSAKSRKVKCQECAQPHVQPLAMRTHTLIDGSRIANLHAHHHVTSRGHARHNPL